MPQSWLYKSEIRQEGLGEEQDVQFRDCCIDELADKEEQLFTLFFFFFFFGHQCNKTDLNICVVKGGIKKSFISNNNSILNTFRAKCVGLLQVFPLLLITL